MTNQPITEEQKEAELAVITSLVFAVTWEEAGIDAHEFGKNLLTTMQRAGTRDALLTLLASAHIQHRNEFAALMALFALDSEVGLSDRPMHIQDNWHTTLAVLLYTMEFNDAALESLDRVMNPEHRMAGLLRQVIESGLPGTRYTRALQLLSVDECLDFDRPSCSGRG
jgi:hypothetical protein